MYLRKIENGAVTLRLFTDDCRVLALACHAAAAHCIGSVPNGDRELPSMDPDLGRLYAALAMAFESVGIVTYAQADVPPDRGRTLTPHNLRTGKLDA